MTNNPFDSQGASCLRKLYPLYSTAIVIHKDSEPPTHLT
jgi:hypothetical protein